MFSREDRDAIPGTLTTPDSFVADVSERLGRKVALHALEFLEEDDIRF